MISFSFLRVCAVFLKRRSAYTLGVGSCRKGIKNKGNRVCKLYIRISVDRAVDRDAQRGEISFAGPPPGWPAQFLKDLDLGFDRPSGRLIFSENPERLCGRSGGWPFTWSSRPGDRLMVESEQILEPTWNWIVLSADQQTLRGILKPHMQ